MGCGRCSVDARIAYGTMLCQILRAVFSTHFTKLCARTDSKKNNRERKCLQREAGININNVKIPIGLGCPLHDQMQKHAGRLALQFLSRDCSGRRAAKKLSSRESDPPNKQNALPHAVRIKRCTVDNCLPLRQLYMNSVFVCIQTDVVSVVRS